MARIGVLGPVTVDGADGTLAPREQVVLAALTVRRGQVVSAETLADAWCRRPKRANGPGSRRRRG